jgi:hypothetical protein
LVEVANTEKLLSKTSIIPLFALHGQEYKISSFLLTHTDEKWSFCKLMMGLISEVDIQNLWNISFQNIFGKVERLS